MLHEWIALARIAIQPPHAHLVRMLGVSSAHHILAALQQIGHFEYQLPAGTQQAMPLGQSFFTFPSVDMLKDMYSQHFNRAVIGKRYLVRWGDNLWLLPFLWGYVDICIAVQYPRAASYVKSHHSPVNSRRNFQASAASSCFH